MTERMVEVAFAIFTAFIASIVWAFNVEGRVRVLEKVLEGRKELFAELNHKMDRIEGKVDQWCLHCAAVHGRLKTLDAFAENDLDESP